MKATVKKSWLDTVTNNRVYAGQEVIIRQKTKIYPQKEGEVALVYYVVETSMNRWLRVPTDHITLKKRPGKKSAGTKAAASS